jgi:hypothetical protein
MRTLLSIVLLTILAVISLTLALRSERFIAAAVEITVERLSSLDLELVKPSFDLLGGKVTAEQIHLYQDDTSGPALISVLNFKADIEFSNLVARNLSSTNLSADAVMIYTSSTDSAEDPTPIDWLEYVRWLPKEMTIGTVHLVSNEENVWIFPLKNVIGQRTKQQTFRISAAADYEGEALQLDLSLLGLRNEKRFTGVELSGEIVAPDSGSRVNLYGEVQASHEDFSYDLAIEADYKHIEDFLDGFESAAQLLDGSLTLKGQLSGNLDGYTISAEQVIIDNMPAYGFEASGQLVQMRDQDAQISLIAAGELASTARLTAIAGVDFSPLGSAQANVVLSGTLSRPRVEEFILITRNNEGLAINMSGQLSFGELMDGSAEQGNEITIDASGPSLASVEQWIGKQPFETGPWFSSSRISGTREGVILEDLIVEFGTPDTIRFRAEGNVDRIDPRQPFTLAKVTGIDLEMTAATDDTAILREWFELEIPSYHSAKASAIIRGSGDDIMVSSGLIDVESSDLEAKISNIGMRVTGIETLDFSEFGAQLTIELSDTSALSQYLQREFMSLGPISATSTVVQRGDDYALESFKAQVTSEDLNIELEGSIEHLVTLKGTRLDMDFSGLDTRATLATLLDDFSYPSYLGSLTGSFKLINPDGKWSLADLVADNTGSDRIALTLKGEINDITGFTTGNLDSQFEVRDREVLRSVSGFAIEPTKGALTVKTSPGLIDIDTSLLVGQTDISSEARVSHDRTKITGLIAKTSTPKLLLKDLGLQADTQSSAGYSPAERLDPIAQDRKPRRLLERTPAFPTDLELDIGSIRGENIAIDRLQIHTTGENGRYTLRKFNLDYAEGKAEVRGIIDLNPQPIAVSLAGQGIALPLNKLSTDLGMDTDIEGILSFRGGIVARGIEREELLSSLDGSLAVALQDAEIEGAAYDLLATSVLEWVYSGAAMETSTHIDCTMGQFSIKSGVARSDNLFIETKRMVATGTAKVDLPRQRLDITIEPLSKSRRLQIPSSVTLRGDFDNPKVITSPITATANAYAEALMLIPSLTLKMFGIERSNTQETRPCEAHTPG